MQLELTINLLRQRSFGLEPFNLYIMQELSIIYRLVYTGAVYSGAYERITILVGI